MQPSGRQTLVILAVLLCGCPQGKSPLSRYIPATDGMTSWPEPAADGGLAPDSVLPDSTLAPDGFDCNGQDLHPGCACKPGTTRPCYTGDPATRLTGQCRDGTQTCDASGMLWQPDCAGQVLPAAEACDDGIDNDCDGQIDEGCPVKVAFSGDCVWVTCPASAPYPVGCSITMDGGDCRGCVAHASGSSQVYFQEGDSCSSSGTTGHLLCSSAPGSGLDATNCNFDKKYKYYVAAPEDCPTDGGTGC